MLVNANLSWQHAVLSALVMSSAVSANYGSVHVRRGEHAVHVRRGEHAVRDILPTNADALKERDLLSTLSSLLGGAGAGADDAAAEQQQGGKNQAKQGAAGAGEAAAGAQDEEAQEDAAQGEAAQGEAAQGEDAQEADDEEAQGEGQASKSSCNLCFLIFLLASSTLTLSLPLSDLIVQLLVGSVPLTSYSEGKGAQGEAGSKF